jgi:hypothetical protein
MRQPTRRCIPFNLLSCHHHNGWFRPIWTPETHLPRPIRKQRPRTSLDIKHHILELVLINTHIGVTLKLTSAIPAYPLH